MRTKEQNKLKRLNKLFRRSFKSLNQRQTQLAFVRHYFIVEALRAELENARTPKRIERKEYVSL